MLTSNANEFLAGIKASPDFVRRKFANKVRDVVYTLHHSITERTPVYTGQTLANYQWSMGTPFSGVLDAVGVGPVEHTNQLPLGVESRRPENQAVADESLFRLRFENPYQNYVLVNNCPTFGPLEAGEWPNPPLRQRSPNGMVFVSFAYVSELLQSGVL